MTESLALATTHCTLELLHHRIALDSSSLLNPSPSNVSTTPSASDLTSLLTWTHFQTTELWHTCQSWDALLDAALEDAQAHASLLDSILRTRIALHAIEIEEIKFKVYALFHGDRISDLALKSYSLLFSILPLYARIEEAVEEYLNGFDASDDQSECEELHLDETGQDSYVSTTSLHDASEVMIDQQEKSSPHMNGWSSMMRIEAVGEATEADTVRGSELEGSFSSRDCALAHSPSSSENAIDTSNPKPQQPGKDLPTASFTQQVSQLITVLSQSDLTSTIARHSLQNGDPNCPINPHVRSRDRTRADNSGNEIVEAGWYRLLTASGVARDVYCRIVGSIVMVRVGGGWLQIEAFLESWSAHHSARAQAAAHKNRPGPAIAKLCKNKDGALKVMSWHSLEK